MATRMMKQSSVPFNLLDSYCRQNREWRMTHPAEKFCIVDLPHGAWNALDKDADAHGVRCLPEKSSIVVHRDTTFVIPATLDKKQHDMKVEVRGGRMTVSYVRAPVRV